MNRPILAATVACLFLLASCQKEEAQGGPPAYPPAKVSVITTKLQSVPITNDLPGRVAATRIAEVRPRATGIVVKRVFQQGSMVKEGDILYQIDPAPFKLQVESAQATLRRAEAVRLQAKQSADRQDQLRRSNVSSAQQFDDAVAQLAQAEADVAIAQSSLATADLNLQYASVTAPISGRIGRALITEGALVSANGSENLATIQQLDPVYADFTQSATDLIRLRKGMQDEALSGNKNEAKVKLVMDDGQPYAHEGKLLFSEAAVDETTGQVTLRGEFPNPDGDLLPGMYVRVMIEQGVRNDAILLPSQAIQRDTAGKAQVYVLKADDTTELRDVVTSQAMANEAVVTSGLKADEKVIVEGFQKVQPGAKVVPSAWDPNAPAGNAAADAKPAADGAGTADTQPAAADAKPADAAAATDAKKGDDSAKPAEPAK